MIYMIMCVPAVSSTVEKLTPKGNETEQFGLVPGQFRLTHTFIVPTPSVAVKAGFSRPIVTSVKIQDRSNFDLNIHVCTILYHHCQ